MERAELRPGGRSLSPMSTGSAGGACPAPAPCRQAPAPRRCATPLDAKGTGSEEGDGAAQATDASLASIEENVIGLCQDTERLHKRAKFVQQLLVGLQNDLYAERAATL